MTYKVPRLRLAAISLEADREPWMDAAFAYALSRRDGAFVDIGVNQGQSLGKKLRIDPTRPYVGFEPQTACADAVRRFIARNKLLNHTIVPVGLSDSDGVCPIWYQANEEADAAASIIEGYRPKNFYERCDYIVVLRGDSVMRKLNVGPISTIKIDVEGAEPEVLAGLRSVLIEHSPTVIFEVLHNIVVVTGQPLDDDMVRERNQRAERISKFFGDIGYVVFNIRNGALFRRTVIRPEVSRDMSTTNYLALPAAEAPEDGCKLPLMDAP